MSFQPKTVLVTGGCGFIGSNFIRWALETQPECALINLDALTYAGNLANLADAAEKHEGQRYFFLRGDVADRRAVDHALSGEASGGRKPDAIVHFAAESHVDRSIMDSSDFIRTNILGTQTLLDAGREAGVQRHLQVSTDEVYGSLEPDDPPFVESLPLAPNSPYSASKASADLLVRAACKTHGCDGVITRCSNNYGPYQFPEKLIPLMILRAMKGEPLPVYGDGMNIRDWIHVSDHVAALWAVLTLGEPGEIYNIGGNCERPNLEIVRTILKSLDKPETLIRYVTDRPAHDRRYAVDSGHIAQQLGWAPKIGFEEGIESCIAWYKEHTDWSQAVMGGEYQRYYQRWYGDRAESA